MMLGGGILKGMAVTARNFVGSYFVKERMTTVQYPEERAPLPENYRNFPFLVFDGEASDAGLRCVACKICEKECPPQCIYIVKSDDKKPDFVGKPQFYPAQFDIDISVCMSCQICVEVCPFDAIKMDKVYELSSRSGSTRCSCASRSSRSRTSITTGFIPRRPPTLMLASRQPLRQRPRRRSQPSPLRLRRRRRVIQILRRFGERAPFRRRASLSC
jgi:formate hydrogenlyase subunit 6/NADH:ubiquinone oxidoreductase subunit I